MSRLINPQKLFILSQARIVPKALKSKFPYCQIPVAAWYLGFPQRLEVAMSTGSVSRKCQRLIHMNGLCISILSLRNRKWTVLTLQQKAILKCLPVGILHISSIMVSEKYTHADDSPLRAIEWPCTNRSSALSTRIARRVREVRHMYCLAMLLLWKIWRISENVSKLNARTGGVSIAWAFAELQSFVEYKAAVVGISVAYVTPEYTSQRCSCCGHASR